MAVFAAIALNRQVADVLHRAVHAGDHASEHGIASAIGVQKVVVHHVDEKLLGRAVEHIGAGHGDGAYSVAQASGGMK